ncbi:hypothetical protein [Niallia nealsonii]|uniref:Uncharacterized protein n=1 Tax=Niallia nealsonii TaxID=115979 RepID=A0A2N0YZP4_9BACI|nr:hypothetical protein [Niallia nealsonii]PKG22728.1 hypothetical protein CWS01_15565 [Niallia nealsonii]
MKLNLSRPEAYSLMSEADHEYMNQKIKELEKIIGNCSNVNLQFYLIEQELFLEISSGKRLLYRLMFSVTKEVDLPSLHTNKENVIQLSKNNECFKCVDNEAVLEVAEVLENALTREPPFIMTVKNGVGEYQEIASREEFLEHYLSWAIGTLYDLTDTEE